jgi:subtilisin family serine protease
MKAYAATGPQTHADTDQAPSEELRIAVTFKAGASGIGLTKLAGRPSPASVQRLTPDPLDVDRGIEALHRRGFVVTARGAMSVSMRGSRKLFEETFGTRLAVFRLDPKLFASAHRFYFPPPGAAWNPDPTVSALIDDAYIQWPHIYMARAAKRPAAGAKPARKAAGKRAAPATTAHKAAAGSAIPTVPYYHLEVIPDVPRLLGASTVHAAKGTGKGVRLAMIDTGFAHAHPWFKKNKFKSTVVLAPGATSRKTDPGSHGTGESANVFAVAPGVKFVGVKLEDDGNPGGGASILEGFQEALKHKPRVISCSMGYDLRQGNTLSPLTALPNSLKALEAEIQAAVASGITVVFSAGNGHYSFPGMMPEVISAGGVYVEANGDMRASDYASAFPSAIYSGRSVPDFCGLVGMQPHADYIMLPVPPGKDIDADNASHDKTKPDDGWAVFSGTSAAAPQLAGVCALLLERNPQLTPADIRAILARTARDVTTGRANFASDANGVGIAAGPGKDGATGTGLVDAAAAWDEA